MTLLLIGLILFLGVHMVRVVADDWRSRTIARIGEGPWKGVYSVISIVGLVLIVWGFSLARHSPVVIWQPPLALRHLTSLFTVVAFVFLAAAYGPPNHIRARLGHPMTLAVKLWAFGHLIANGSLADLFLFGGFLVWSVLVYRAARRRPSAPPAVKPSVAADLVVVVIGLAVWALFAFWLHGMLFGVRPFG